MVSKRKAEDQLYAGFGKKAFTYYNNVAEEVGTTVFNATSTPPTPFRVNGVNVTASSLHSIPVTTSTANSVQSVSTDNIKEYIIPTNGAHLSIYTGLPTLKEYCLSLAIPTTSLSASSASSLNPSMLVPNVAAITSTLVTQPPVSEPQFSFVVAPTSSITAPVQSFWSGPHYSKLMAKLRVSVKACMRLHELGALDLRPVTAKANTWMSLNNEGNYVLRRLHPHPCSYTHHNVVSTANQIITSDDTGTSREIRAAMELLVNKADPRDVCLVYAFVLFLRARNYLLLFIESHPLSPIPHLNGASSPLAFQFRKLGDDIKAQQSFTCEMTIQWHSGITRVVSDPYKEQSLAICHASLLLCMRLELLHGVTLRQAPLTGVTSVVFRSYGLSIFKFFLGVEAFVAKPDGPFGLTRRRDKNFIRPTSRIIEISGNAFLTPCPKEQRKLLVSTLAMAMFAGGFDLVLRVVKDLVGCEVFSGIDRWGGVAEAFKARHASAFLYFTPRLAPLSEQEIEEIEATIKYRFRSKAILQNAFRLKSPVFERLEYLGDAILGLLATLYWIRNLREKEWGQAPQFNVSNNFFGRMFYVLGLCKYVRPGPCKNDFVREVARIDQEVARNGKNCLRYLEVSKALADALEALVGAVLVDSDFEISGPNTVFMKAVVPLVSMCE
ncbi:hypothetical protein BX616_008177 [Lobosporangium transversale]|nr:hypothetical protein BX616_008177 [Lobosporangium transversale]